MSKWLSFFIPHQRISIAPKKLKHNRAEPSLDTTLDELEVLKRYEIAFTTLVINNKFSILDKPLSESDVGKSITDSILDVCVVHALEGDKYIDQIRENVQYTVLQAALIVTITVPLYVNPPPFESDNLEHAFSAVIGFAAFSHLGCIIGCTITCALLNSAYSAVDTLVVYKDNRPHIAFIFLLNYIAILSTMAAVLIAGFNRSNVDGFVQLYSIAIVAALVRYINSSYTTSANDSDRRCLKFYQKYCDSNGELKDEYLRMIYGDALCMDE